MFVPLNRIGLRPSTHGLVRQNGAERGLVNAYQSALFFGNASTRPTKQEILFKFPTAEQANLSVATIKVKGFQGTGFFYQPKGKEGPYLISNAHVVQALEDSKQDLESPFDVYIRDPRDGKSLVRLKARLAKKDFGYIFSGLDAFHDRVVIQIIDPIPFPITPLEFRDLETNPLKIGEELCLLGRSPYRGSQSLEDSASMGEVLEANCPPPWSLESQWGREAKYFRSTIEISPGDSGSPIIDKEGRVVALHARSGGHHIRIDDVYSSLKVIHYEPELGTN